MLDFASNSIDIMKNTCLHYILKNRYVLAPGERRGGSKIVTCIAFQWLPHAVTVRYNYGQRVRFILHVYYSAIQFGVGSSFICMDVHLTDDTREASGHLAISEPF